MKLQPGEYAIVECSEAQNGKQYLVQRAKWGTRNKDIQGICTQLCSRYTADGLRTFYDTSTMSKEEIRAAMEWSTTDVPPMSLPAPLEKNGWNIIRRVTKSEVAAIKLRIA
jgi:hypothetical protein